MAQFRGHRGEADYEIVGLDNGTAVVLRYRNGRLLNNWQVPNYAHAVEYVRWNRQMDRDKFNER